jgi:hypothetical protein
LDIPVTARDILVRVGPVSAATPLRAVARTMHGSLRRMAVVVADEGWWARLLRPGVSIGLPEIFHPQASFLSEFAPLAK